MHTFAEYGATEQAQLLRLVRQNPFALLVSIDGNEPIATHLPVVLPAGTDSQTLTGQTLWGHMARANQQWQTLSAERPALLVFTGADAYVSAGLYQQTPAVPTWNYSAVHVSVRPEIVTDPSQTLDILTATVRAVEADRAKPWDMTESVDHFARIAAGVVAFRLHVQEVRAVFKLSQDKPAAIWHRVHDGLASDPTGTARQVAADMAAVRVEGRCGQAK